MTFTKISARFKQGFEKEEKENRSENCSIFRTKLVSDPSLDDCI